jgi:heme oxygenase
MQEYDTHSYLRDVTRSAHLAIENVLSLQDADLTLERYKMVLARLYGFWAAWEVQISELYNDDSFLAPRRRAHLLAADLTSLQFFDAERFPPCPRVPINDRWMALGSIYVMEGSSLGGRVILHNVERCLGEVGKQSSRYFAGYGEQTGTMWREFLERLNETSPYDRELVGRGALATFDSFGRWLRPSDTYIPPGVLTPGS